MGIKIVYILYVIGWLFGLCGGFFGIHTIITNSTLKGIITIGISIGIAFFIVGFSKIIHLLYEINKKIDKRE